MNPKLPRDTATEPVQPWWRYGMVWLVIAGPLAVVVAGFATLAIAIAHPDPVIATHAVAADDAAAPAVQARNQAAAAAAAR